LRVLQCFLLGAVYIGLFQVGSIYLPAAFVASSQYAGLPFWYKIAYMTVAGRVVLMKYLGIWTLGEGSAILSGISFNGYDERDKPVWTGLANVDLGVFETTTSLGQVISSFNMNTNIWSKNYVFKRLRFLGHKTLSGLGTLLFLAIWHGFAFGYFGAFGLEFLDMMCEKNLREWMWPLFGHLYTHPQPQTMPAQIQRTLWNIIFYLLTVSTLSVGSVTFDLLTWDRVSKFWSALYYYNHIGIGVILLLGLVSPPKSRPTLPAVQKKQQ
jgi:lysophospholipid acyltransferase 5